MTIHERIKVCAVNTVRGVAVLTAIVACWILPLVIVSIFGAITVIKIGFVVAIIALIFRLV